MNVSSGIGACSPRRSHAGTDSTSRIGSRRDRRTGIGTGSGIRGRKRSASRARVVKRPPARYVAATPTSPQERTTHANDYTGGGGGRPAAERAGGGAAGAIARGRAGLRAGRALHGPRVDSPVRRRARRGRTGPHPPRALRGDGGGAAARAARDRPGRLPEP